MPEASKFPQVGETRSYYCNDCQQVVDWEIIEKEGVLYWHTSSCDKTVQIGKWPEEEKEN